MKQPSAYIITQETLGRLDGICIGLQNILSDIYSICGAPDDPEDEAGVDYQNLF